MLFLKFKIFFFYTLIIHLDFVACKNFLQKRIFIMKYLIITFLLMYFISSVAYAGNCTTVKGTTVTISATCNNGLSIVSLDNNFNQTRPIVTLGFDNNLSLEDVESKWGETIQFISGNRPSLGSVMESCNLTNLHGKLLEISLSNQPSFNLNLLEKNKKIIEVQLKELLEKTIVIKFILDKSKNDAVLKTENNTIKTTGDTIENKDQTLLKIIERFDGEILK